MTTAAAYVLDVTAVKVFNVPGSAAPPAPSTTPFVTDLAPGLYEVHGTGPFIIGAQDADPMRCVYADYDLPRLLRWTGDRIALAARSGAAIVVTVTPVLTLDEARAKR